MIGQGQEGCIIREGHDAYKVMFGKDEAAMNREVQINNSLRALDPDQKRFVVPSNTFRVDLETLERTRPELFNIFVTRCLETPERPAVVYIGMMPVLQPLDEDGLSNGQKAYVRESIQFMNHNGIAHNDVHLNNIMFHVVDGTRYPVIIDFGRASSMQDRVQDDTEQFNSFFVSRPPALKRRRRPDDE